MHGYVGRHFKDIVKKGSSLTDCEFTDCVFEDCKFSECAFSSCKFSDCTFIRCKIEGLKDENVHMVFSRFSECTLIGIYWARLLSSGLSLPIKSLDNCYLRYNDFDSMDMKRFDFGKSSIERSVFFCCNLSDAVLCGCDLNDTEFISCDLRRADMRRAKNYKLTLTDNNVKKAKFSYPEVMTLLGSLVSR